MTCVRLIAACFLLTGFILGCSPHREQAINEQKSDVVSGDLPDIELLPEEGEKFSAKTLPANTIMIFFAPDCDHCQREAQQIQEQLAAFSNYTLYFVSMDSFKAMHQFAKDYRLDHIPSVRFVRANGESVLKALGDVTTPTICVYGKNRKLNKRFDGETAVEDIIAAL